MFPCTRYNTHYLWKWVTLDRKTLNLKSDSFAVKAEAMAFKIHDQNTSTKSENNYINTFSFNFEIPAFCNISFYRWMYSLLFIFTSSCVFVELLSCLSLSDKIRTSARALKKSDIARKDK